MEHKPEELGYAYNALEPAIDQKTMEIHHDKHYTGYVTKLNTALESHNDLRDKTITELLADISALPEEIRIAVKNNGGGALNHAMFWKILKKDVAISGEISKAINNEFGNFENFKEQFSGVSAKLFGSGWAWLVVDDGKLSIETTVGHDTPLSEGKTPILLLDLWEHAYYLNYQNRRPEYIEAFWSIINWDIVNEFYNLAK